MADPIEDTRPVVIGLERKERKSILDGKTLGADGVWRLKETEEALNNAFAHCFATPPGRIVLQHLKEITLARVCGPDATDAQLRYLEGQRFLASVILNRIERGRKK